MNTKAMDLDAATDAELEAYLASNLQGMREPCPYDAEGVAYTFRYHIERPSTCPKCHGLGYVPRRGLEAVLGALQQFGQAIELAVWLDQSDKPQSCVDVYPSQADPSRGFGDTASDIPHLYSALLRAAAKAVAAREALIAAEEIANA